MRWTFAGILLAVLLLAACGGGTKTYTKDDLASLVLEASDAPAGTQVNPKNAGVRFLEREGGNEEFFALLRPFGFVADAGSEFYGPKDQIAYAESLAFLFNDRDGASKALAALHRAVPQIGQGVKDVAPPKLGEESFGVSGVFGPKSPPGYFYFWRVRNVVLSFTMSGDPAAVTSDSVRSYAEKLEH